MTMWNYAARCVRFELAITLLLTELGCTQFASESDTLEVSSATPQPLDADPEKWGCLSESAGNPVMPADGPPLDYPFNARDYVSGQTPRNLQGRACFRPDVACSRPATEHFTPDANGIVTLPLTEGFSGYIEITSDDMVPTLLLFPAPLTPELARNLSAVPVSLLPFEALLAFGVAGNLVLEPTAGVVSINTFDCLGPSAPDIRLELSSAGAVPFTFVDGLPIAGLDTTTDDGTGGFANVPPGLAVVRGFRAGTSDLVGLESVLVRSQWVTVGSLMPQFAHSP
jgi:hypothetical protein